MEPFSPEHVPLRALTFITSAATAVLAIATPALAQTDPNPSPPITNAADNNRITVAVGVASPDVAVLQPLKSIINNAEIITVKIVNLNFCTVAFTPSNLTVRIIT